MLNLSISKEPREEVNYFFKSDFLHKSDQHCSEIQEKQRCFMLQEEEKKLLTCFSKTLCLGYMEFFLCTRLLTRTVFSCCVLMKWFSLPIFRIVLLQVWLIVRWHRKSVGITKLDAVEMGPGTSCVWVSDSSLEENLRLLFWKLEAHLLILSLLVVSICPFLLRYFGCTFWSLQVVYSNWHCFCGSIRLWDLQLGQQGGGQPCPYI